MVIGPVCDRPYPPLRILEDISSVIVIPGDQIDSRYGEVRENEVKGELRVIPTFLETAYNLRNMLGRLPTRKTIVLAEDNLKTFGELNRFYLYVRTFLYISDFESYDYVELCY